MKIIKPSVEIIEQGAGLDGIYAQIERAGRSCYASSHRIGEGTAKPFVDNLIKSGHGAMLEHGAVYLQMPYNKTAYEAFAKNPYSKVSAIEEAGSMFISTNYRVIIENKLEDLLKYLVEPGPMHERRVTVRFQCQIAISREFNRHRVDSIAEQSTRYCNYSANKFGNEITVNSQADEVDETFEYNSRKSRQNAYHETEQQDELLMAYMSSCVSHPIPRYLSKSQSSSTSLR